MSLSSLDVDRQELYSKTLDPQLAPYDSGLGGNNRCIQCHSNVRMPFFATADSILNYKNILKYKLINFVKPEKSKLLHKLRSGHQGFSEDVIEGIEQAVIEWIDLMSENSLPYPGSPEEKNYNLFPNFAQNPAISSLMKIKKLTTGEPVTKNEVNSLIKDGSLDVNGLKAKVDIWMNTLQFRQKIREILGLFLQQDGKYSVADHDRFIGRFTFGKNLTSSITRGEYSKKLRLLQGNIDDSFRRTASEIIYSDKPFTDVNTTQRWAVTTALLSLMAYSEKFNDDPNDFDLTGFTNRKKFSNLLQQNKITNRDFNDWRWINFKKISNRLESPLFTNLSYFRGLENEDEVKFADPKVGFFSTIAFKLAWSTNEDNQFRVFANQIVMASLNKTFEAGDDTSQTIFAGIPKEHAKKGSSCYSCHQRMDPMRNIFANNYNFNYRYRDPSLSKNPSSFAFHGLSRTVSSISEFGKALSEHPRFAKSWTEKLCFYLNSKSCSSNDPEIARISELFKSNNFNFKILFKELITSPVVTGAERTRTHEETGDMISFTRHGQFCSTLNTRLRRVQKVNSVKLNPNDAGKFLCSIPEVAIGASSIPGENNVRGDILPSLPPTSSAISLQAIETACYKIGTAYIGTGRTFDLNETNVSIHLKQFIEYIVGIPENHPRYNLFLESMIHLYSFVRDKGGSYKESLIEAFVLGCSSPDVAGEGL